MEFKVYRCKHCGKIITMLNERAVPTICCGEVMEELKANVTDGALEKHVPCIEKEGNKVVVKVGSIPHPMLPEHFIEWIVLETNQKVSIVHLAPNMEPKATFTLEENEEVVSAYEYCNLHGFWKK